MSIITKVQRYPDRGRYDRETLNRILDEGLVCHVAFEEEKQPYNVPMIYFRDGDFLFIHGSVKSRIYTELSSGKKACVAVTIVDGIVLAKSAFHSSINYRSAMVFGSFTAVNDKDDKLRLTERLIEKIAAGRWADCRTPTEGELDITGFLKLPITEFSSKTRTGGPIDDQKDLNLQHWSGVIPVSIERGEPETSALDSGKIAVPEYARS